jgi:CheY-like chemotaxis protein
VSAGSGESILRLASRHLVVEDNDDMRAFTAQVLSALGYRVTLAPDGKRALKVLQALRG